MKQEEKNERLQQKIIMALGSQTFTLMNLEIENEALRQELMKPAPPNGDDVKTNTNPPVNRENENEDSD